MYLRQNSSGRDSIQTDALESWSTKSLSGEEEKNRQGRLSGSLKEERNILEHRWNSISYRHCSQLPDVVLSCGSKRSKLTAKESGRILKHMATHFEHIKVQKSLKSKGRKGSSNIETGFSILCIFSCLLQTVQKYLNHR